MIRSGMRRQISGVSYRGRTGFVNWRELKTMMTGSKGWIYAATGKSRETLRLKKS